MLSIGTVLRRPFTFMLADLLAVLENKKVKSTQVIKKL